MGRGESEHRGRFTTTTGGPDRAQYIAVASGNHCLWYGAAQLPGGLQIRTHPGAGQEPVQRTGQLRGVGGDERGGGPGAARRPIRESRRLIRRCRAVVVQLTGILNDQTQPTCLPATGVSEGGSSGVGIGYHRRPGKFAEQTGQRVLPARSHGHGSGERAHHAGDANLGELSSSVLGVKRQGEGIATGGPGGQLGSGLTAGVGSGSDFIASVVECSGGRLMGGGGPCLLSDGGLGRIGGVRRFGQVGTKRGGFSLPQSSLGCRGALLGGLHAGACLLDGGASGLMAGASGGQASAGSGEHLAMLGAAVLQGRKRLLRACRGGLRLHTLPGGIGQGTAGRLNGGGQLGLLCSGLLRAAVQFIGVGAGHGAGGFRQAAHAFGGDIGEGAQGLGRGGELLPSGGGAGQALPGGGLDAGQLRQLGTGQALGLFQFGATMRQTSLILLAGFEQGLHLHHVVGQQPGGGVAHLCLDDMGAAGDGGLPGQWPELAVQLRGQIG